MSYKILEQNGVDNENIDGGAFNNFSAGNRDGIIGGVLAECAVAAVGNSIGISPGELIIHGIRVKLLSVETLALTSAPSEPIRYQIIAQIELKADKSIAFSIFVQEVTDLIQEELYASDLGTYQVEVARFTHGTNGNIEDLSKTLDVIYGGTGGGGDFEIGNVTSKVIDATLPAEAEVNKRIKDGKIYIDFEFYFPDTQEVMLEAILAKNAAVAAQTAAENAQTAAESAEVSANSSMLSATASARASETSATQAAESATQAEHSKNSADVSAINAQLAANRAQSSATAAEGSAQSASNSALQAQGYMEQAKEYAQKEYQIYDSFSDLPIPGNSAYIYLVPSTSGVANDDYSEYLWISNTNQYEYVGSLNDVDLANYAQVNGTYQNMTAGAADRLSRQLYIGVSSGTPGWYQVGHISAADMMAQGNNVNTSSVSIIFLINGMNGTGAQAGTQPSGLLEVDSRIYGGVFDSNAIYHGIKVLAGNIIAEEYCLTFDDAREKLYLYKKLYEQYMAVEFVVVSEQYGTYPTKAFVFDGTFESAEMPSGGIVGVNVNNAGYVAGAQAVPVYTTIQALGLQNGVTTADVINAMPALSMAMIECSQTGIPIADIPSEFGILIIHKQNNSRIDAIYQRGLGNNCVRWVGWQQRTDATAIESVTWKQIVVEDGSYPDLGAGKISAKVLVSGDDLNDCIPTEVGQLRTWFCANIADAQGILNYPSSSTTPRNAFMLEAMTMWKASSAARVVQRIFIATNSTPADNIFIRTLDGTVWTDWEMLPTSIGVYPTMGAGLDGKGNEITTTYAQQNGSYPAMSAGALARMGVAAGSNTQADIGWWKLGEVTAASLTNVVSFGGDYSVLFLFNGVSPMGSTENYAQSGMVELDGRVTNGAFVTGGANQLKILSGNLEENDVAAVWSADKIELYCNLKTTYSKQAAVVVSEIIHTSAANCFAFAPSYASASIPAGAAYAVNVNQAAYDGEGNNIAQTYARQSGNYPDLSVGSATSASQASFATSDSLGNNIADTYAKQNGTYYSMTVGKARADESGRTISSTYLQKGDLLGFSQIHEKTQVYSILRQRSVLFAFCQNEETFGVGGHTAQFAIMFRLEEAGTIFVFSVNNGSVSVDNINLMNCELDPQEHNLFYMTIYPF